VSFRFLYRRLPVNERRCSYYDCQKPIFRNITRDKHGRIYHYGCLQTALDERWRCLECLMVFDATECAFEEEQLMYGDDVKQKFVPVCPGCSSRNLKKISGRPD
jgi:hypothetical protein